MSAYLVVIDEKDWDVVKKYLGALGEGGILVTPEGVEAFKKEHGVDLRESDGELVKDYDFGGDPDVWVDALRDAGSYAADAVKKHLGLKQLE